MSVVEVEVVMTGGSKTRSGYRLNLEMNERTEQVKLLLRNSREGVEQR